MKLTNLFRRRSRFWTHVIRCMGGHSGYWVGCPIAAATIERLLRWNTVTASLCLLLWPQLNILVTRVL